jgi:Arc/MetJ-type ribon-helix-helix transcriptional regulator
MSYPFPPDLDERIRARMSGGAYQSEDDVLREALNALDEREQETLRRWNERNQTAMEQSRLGVSTPLDLDRILGRVEQRMADHQGK